VPLAQNRARDEIPGLVPGVRGLTRTGDEIQKKEKEVSENGQCTEDMAFNYL
jgi:hypothetical protein